MTYTAHAAHTAPSVAAPRARPPAMSPGLVLLRGLVASGFAVLAGLVITYLVRVMLNLDAFQNAGVASGGFPNSGALSAGICIATLIAVAVLFVLGRVSPRPFATFAVIMGLGYLAFFGVTLAGNLSASQIAGYLLAGLPFAVVVTALAGWATGIHPDTP